MKKIFVGSVRIGEEFVEIFLICDNIIEVRRFLTKQEHQGKEVTDPEFKELHIEYEECLPDIKRILEQLGYRDGAQLSKKQ